MFGGACADMPMSHFAKLPDGLGGVEGCTRHITLPEVGKSGDVALPVIHTSAARYSQPTTRPPTLPLR